jgi:hypothetical protein
LVGEWIEKEYEDEGCVKGVFPFIVGVKIGHVFVYIMGLRNWIQSFAIGFEKLDTKM